MLLNMYIILCACLCSVGKRVSKMAVIRVTPLVHFQTHNNAMIHLEGYIQAETILEIAIPIYMYRHIMLLLH